MMLPLPRLAEDRLARLRPAVRRQYVCAWTWLRARYDGPWDRTEPLQALLTAIAGARTRPPPLRVRILRSLLNGYLEPPLRGPRLAIRAAALRKRAKKRGGGAFPPWDAPWAAPWENRGNGIGIDVWWWHYVPRYARPLLCASPAWSLYAERFVTAVGPNPLRRNTIRVYVAHVLRVLGPLAPANAPCACRTPEDFARLNRGDLAAAVAAATRDRPGQRRLCVNAINRFLREVALRDCAPIAARLRLCNRDISDDSVGGAGGAPLPDGGPGDDNDDHPAHFAARRAGAGARARDHFTAAEVAALLTAPDLRPRDRLLFAILAETGLRRRAAAWLQVASVYDRAAGAALDVCCATEKGLVPRRFLLSGGTRRLLAEYMRDHHPDPARSPWLFPCPHDPRRPVAPHTVNLVLRRACQRIGLVGRHVHVHGVRKYVICTLLSNRQNRLEHVSKWIGHRCVNTTFGAYWDATPHELAESMHIPWLLEEGKDDAVDVDDDNVAVADDVAPHARVRP